MTEGSRTNPAPDKTRVARTLVVLAAAALAASMIGLSRHIEAVSTWFYDLCWWSYIVGVDAVVYLRERRSLLLSKPRAFLLLAIWSAFLWLCFEIANLRLENWYYVGIPPDWFSRGPGVLLSFATVLPGLFETYALLASFRVADRVECNAWKLGPRGRRWIAALGWVSLVTPLIWPRYFYPLIWAVPVLLGEPWLDARGARGLSSTWRAGDPRPIVRMLAAGAVCGLLWESWNYWASAKWIYTVPFFDELKLFEMPLLGFVGFLPFALACFTCGRVLVELGWLSEWELHIEPRGAGPRGDAWKPALAALVLCVPAIGAVNAFTLHATLPRVREIPGIDPEFAQRMERDGLTFVGAWLRAVHADAPWRASVAPRELAAWIASAELMQVRGLGARGVEWLRRAEVLTVHDLARADPERLHGALEAERDGPHPRPALAEIRVWVRGARAQAAVARADGSS